MGNTEEYFDIYDREMQWQGTAARSEVHAKGLWHQTFHCWIVQIKDGVPHLLFQRRHASKDTYPGLLDISCAGHLEAGESVQDGVRELQEELGLYTSFDQLSLCGMYAEDNELPNGGRDREFCHVFWMECDQELTDYRVQEDEVVGLYWIKLSDVGALINKEVGEVLASGVDYAPSCGVCLEQSAQVVGSYMFRAEEFVPHPEAYYKMLFQSIYAKQNG